MKSAKLRINKFMEAKIMYKLIIVSGVILFFTLQISIFAQDAKFRIPLNGGSVVCQFNTTNCAAKGKFHTGVDYYATNGQYDILATNAGKIVKIQNNGNNDHGLGNAVIIEHKIINAQGGSETIYSLYGHLKSFIPGLYIGESVVKGQKIGTMGSSGYGSPNKWGNTPHLHFEIKYSSILHNPRGSGQHWGYTPTSAANYGYIDSTWFVNSTTLANGNDYASWNFNGASNLEGWSLINIEGWSVNNGILFDDPKNTDPHIKSPDIFVDASVLKYVKLRIASNALDNNGAIYFKTNSSNSYSEDKKITFTVSNCSLCSNAPFKNYSINLGTHPKWNGKITGIRVDPANAGKTGTNTDSIGFDFIKLSPSP